MIPSRLLQVIYTLLDSTFNFFCIYLIYVFVFTVSCHKIAKEKLKLTHLLVNPNRKKWFSPFSK